MANSTATASKMHLIDSAMVLVCLIQDSSAVATFSHSLSRTCISHVPNRQVFRCKAGLPNRLGVWPWRHPGCHY